MKLFIQIPCYNEEQTLPLVLKSIPKKIPGIDKIEILVTDDGSTDKTVEVAREFGVHHIISRPHRGLARNFHEGVKYALRHGADIVVNTDGDNQYPQERISDLVQPILSGEAEIVMGDRQTSKIAHFSLFKKLMQRFGSWVVNQAGNTNMPDAASGFRAYSRSALMRLNIVTEFSYCMETIIQAGHKQMVIVSIPIDTNPKTRESRLFKNIWQHMFKSAGAIIRSYIMFRPQVIFNTLGTIMLIVGGIPILRFILFSLAGSQRGHLQSIVIGSALIVGSLLAYALSVISVMLQTNRILLEDQLERLKEIQYKKDD